MKSLIVRAASLYVFTVVVLIAIDLLMRSVHVGWSVIWAAAVLTAVTLLIKPTLVTMFQGAAEKRLGVGQRMLGYLVTFAAELAVWLLTVWFSGVWVSGWFWGYVLPPVYLLLAWIVYDVIDDRIEGKAGEVYDRVQGGRSSQGRTPSASPTAPPVPENRATQAGHADLQDGLTPEQRRMFDEL